MLDAPKNIHRAPLTPLNAPTLLLSTFGLGFLRPAPGTWGSLPPPVLAAALVYFGLNPGWYYSAVGLTFFFFSGACVIWGRYAEQRFGRKDAAEVVADETAAMALALSAASPFIWNASGSWAIYTFIALAFFAFRFFDIVKPWPAKRLEKLPHGWGVLVDDLVAAIYAGIAAQLMVGIAMLVL